MNFGEIKTQVGVLIARNNSTVTAQIPLWIRTAQRRVNNHKNWWFLQTLRQSTLTEDQQSYYYPADASTLYKDDNVLYLYNTTDNKYTILEMIGFEEALKLYGPTTKGVPKHWVAERNAFRLFPIPDDDYNVAFLYYQFLAYLSADADENTLTREYPDLLIEGALAEGFAYLQELNDVQLHEAKFQALLKHLVIRDTDRKLPLNVKLIPKYNVDGTILSKKSAIDDYY